MRTLSSLIDPLRRPAIRRHGEAQAALFCQWGVIAGPEHAGKTEPVRLTFPHNTRRDGTLTLCADGPTRLILGHETPALIARINAYFGYHAVARLRFVDGAVGDEMAKPARNAPRQPTPPDWEAEIASVADPALRDSLRRLARRVCAPKRRSPHGEDAPVDG